MIDDQNVYATYRVPYPEAPYPQDYIIDQQGIVRYWSDEYDPQEIIRVIDGLLATGIEERVGGTSVPSAVRLSVIPNPSHGVTTIQLQGLAGYASIRIYDALGRCVQIEEGYFGGIKDMSLDLPAGCYAITVECQGKRYASRVTVTK